MESEVSETPLHNAQSIAIAHGVTIAAYHAPYRGNCLKRSLALWFLLRRQGIAADLRIGTRKTDGLFEAHAWVEYQGTVLNDLPDVGERYGAFAGDVTRGVGFR